MPSAHASQRFAGLRIIAQAAAAKQPKTRAGQVVSSISGPRRRGTLCGRGSKRASLSGTVPLQTCEGARLRQVILETFSRVVHAHTGQKQAWWNSWLPRTNGRSPRWAEYQAVGASFERALSYRVSRRGCRWGRRREGGGRDGGKREGGGREEGGREGGWERACKRASATVRIANAHFSSQEKPSEFVGYGANRRFR